MVRGPLTPRPGGCVWGAVCVLWACTGGRSQEGEAVPWKSDRLARQSTVRLQQPSIFMISKMIYRSYVTVYKMRKIIRLSRVYLSMGY